MQKKMEFVPAVKKMFTTWSVQGRSARSEYWWPMLLILIPVIGVIAVVVPQFLCQMRRYNDIGKPSWYAFFSLVPVLGGIWTIYWMLQPSMPEANEFGPVPNT